MLYVIATPIGDLNEISQRALNILNQVETVICESTKETAALLRFHQITGKKYEILDEHSKSDDLQYLLKLCREQDVALVSDCGTPGFCDPGADLISLCRQNKIPVRSILGPSSLMGLLSLAGLKIPEFVFRGFIPAENEARKKEWLKIQKENRAIVLMDTPYRLQKMINELCEHLNERRILLCMNLSQENECVLEGKPQHIQSQIPFEKAEFMILVYPNANTQRKITR